MTNYKIKYDLYTTRNPQEFTLEEFLKKETVGPGWNDLLREMFDRLFTQGWNGDLLQVKEKFGGLRVYLAHNFDDNHLARLLLDLVKEYENRSLTICELCGGFPATVRIYQGWRKTHCDQCYQQEQERKLRK